MNDQNITEETLISDYRAGVRKKVTARRSIFFALLAVILLNMYFFWNSANSFASNEMDNVAAELHKKLQPIAGETAEKLPKILKRLYPVYGQAFEEVFNERANDISDSLVKEYEALEEYSHNKWPKIEKAILNAIETQEEVVYAELGKILGPNAYPQAIVRISENYRLAMEAKLGDLIDKTLKNHINVAEQIKKNADKLVNNPKANFEKLEMQEGVGIILELIGSEMQGPDQFKKYNQWKKSIR